MALALDIKANSAAEPDAETMGAAELEEEDELEEDECMSTTSSRNLASALLASSALLCSTTSSSSSVSGMVEVNGPGPVRKTAVRDPDGALTAGAPRLDILT